MILNIDLNEVPVGSQQFKDHAALFDLKHKQITSIGSPGSISSPSDADDIDGDVMLQPSSACFSSAKSPSRRKRPATVAFDENQSRRKCPITVAKSPSRRKRPATVVFDENQSRRKCPVTVAKGPSRRKRPATVAFDESQSRKKQPVTVVIDESLETDTSQSGVVEEPVTKLSLSTQNLNTQLSLGRTIIDSNLYANENCFPKMSKGLKPNLFDWKEVSVAAPAPTPAPSKGLKITCPVCLDFLIESSTTICGHLFCHSCIDTAISKHKCCPVCLKKLTKRNFHRIYI